MPASNGYNFQIGKPVAEARVPQVMKGDGSQYLELYQKIQGLPEKQVLPLTFEDADGASRFATMLRNSGYAKFRALSRKNMVYVRLWNEEDDKRLAHTKELRELMKKKKAAAATA